MKILYFHQHFALPQGKGGVRSYFMARHLVASGHEVTMVCGLNEMSGVDEYAQDKTQRWEGVIDGIRVIAFPLRYSNKDRFIKRAWIFLKFSWKCIGLALFRPFDVLFATSTPLTVGIPGIVMKCLRRKKFIFEVRDLWPELPREMGVITNPIVLGGMSVLEWLSYRMADGVVGLSPGIVKGVRRRSRQGLGIEMVPNGCDLELFHPRDRGDLSIEGIGEKDFVAVFTGAHGLANGLDAVLDAARVLKRMQRDDIKILFVGDGMLKPHLKVRVEKEALDNCIFLDPMPKLKLTQLVSSAGVGLMILANVKAFYYGTSPNKFFDYIAAGIPVLNNYPGWLSEMINETGCGKAVAPDDPVAFARALIDMADDREACIQMGLASRALAEGKFARDELAGQWVSFVEKIGAGG